LGIGDWGLGIGDWAQSPIPNPQSPIPNPQSPLIFILFLTNINIFYHIKNSKPKLKILKQYILIKTILLK